MKNGSNYGLHLLERQYLSSMFKFLTIGVLVYIFYRLVVPKKQIGESKEVEEDVEYTDYEEID